MHGIVSLLDSKHNQFIEELWAELKQEFSVDGVYVTPYPHFPYHVAQDYDVDKIEPVLQRITSNITTFKVRSSFEDSTEIIWRQREERTRQLMGEE